MMREHAFRSRRVTTTADLQCAMREQRTTLRRRKKLRRFSRIAEQSADNISDVLSCLRLATLAAENTACITKMRHSLEAPLRVDRGVLATPAKRCPRPSPVLCRVLVMQAGPSSESCSRIALRLRRRRRLSQRKLRLHSLLLRAAARDSPTLAAYGSRSQRHYASSA
jgi:hypothetical protein